MQKLEFEEKQLASLKRRTAAAFLDLLILQILLALIIIYSFIGEDFAMAVYHQVAANPQISAQELAAAMQGATALFFKRAMLLALLLHFAYFFAFFATSGQTLGCLGLNIRHVNLSDLAQASWPTAALKAALWVLSMMLFYVPFLRALSSPLRQSLPDYLCKQVVIRA